MGIRRAAPVADDYLDDEEEETPRVRKTRAAVVEDDDEPVRRPRRAVVEDDDDEDEPPAPKTRRRAAPVEDDDEDEEPAPRRTKKAPVVDDDEDLEDEDEDATPRNAAIAQKGWATAKKNTVAGDFAAEFKFTEDEQILKFLEDEPFHSYKQHWVERTGKKSFICLGKGCPLCAVGDTPRGLTAFNVLVITDQPPEVKMLVCGPKLLTKVEKAHGSRNGPLTTHYWSMTRTGTKGSTDYNMQVLKERDLEDWNLSEAEVRKAVKSAKLYGAEAIKPQSKADLREIANEIDD